MFDLVFVLDLSSKSTSAQNESCSSSFPLQLLFWPNFKFLYENLSFNWSNSDRNHLNEETVSPLCSSLWRPTPYRRLWTAAELRTTAGDHSGSMGVRRTVETLELTIDSFERFWLKFDPLKLQISYNNLKFGQNKSCREKEDLQLSFWAEVDLELGSRTKTSSNTAK